MYLYKYYYWVAGGVITGSPVNTFLFGRVWPGCGFRILVFALSGQGATVPVILTHSFGGGTGSHNFGSQDIGLHPKASQDIGLHLPKA